MLYTDQLALSALNKLARHTNDSEPDLKSAGAYIGVMITKIEGYKVREKGSSVELGLSSLFQYVAFSKRSPVVIDFLEKSDKDRKKLLEDVTKHKKASEEKILKLQDNISELKNKQDSKCRKASYKIEISKVQLEINGLQNQIKFCERMLKVLPKP
jgi:peptidoglycan hydrolase CwlO-like protein